MATLVEGQKIKEISVYMKKEHIYQEIWDATKSGH